jgi:hypothetical protein
VVLVPILALALVVEVEMVEVPPALPEMRPP